MVCIGNYRRSEREERERKKKKNDEESAYATVRPGAGVN